MMEKMHGLMDQIESMKEQISMTQVQERIRIEEANTTERIVLDLQIKLEETSNCARILQEQMSHYSQSCLLSRQDVEEVKGGTLEYSEPEDSDCGQTEMRSINDVDISSLYSKSYISPATDKSSKKTRNAAWEKENEKPQAEELTLNPNATKQDTERTLDTGRFSH